jgi:hypothetical protein
MASPQAPPSQAIFVLLDPLQPTTNVIAPAKTANP